MDEAFIQACADSFVPVEELLGDENWQPDWLLREVLLPGTYMIVFGREGLGKSRILYQLAHAFGKSGRSWFGLEVCQTGRVLYLQADMSPEQSAVLIQDAHETGFTGGDIIFPSSLPLLDVLTDTGKGALEELAARFAPKVVIVDTATDVFEGPEDNPTAKKVIQAFRTSFPHSGIIFILHERKKSQFLQAKGMDDEDAYLGAGEWSRKASGVVRLKGINDEVLELNLRKARGIKPWERLRIRHIGKGFYDIDTKEVDAKQALLLWPHFDGASADEVTSIRGVFRNIETATNGRLNANAIKQAYHRATSKGIKFSWTDELAA